MSPLSSLHALRKKLRDTLSDIWTDSERSAAALHLAHCPATLDLGCRSASQGREVDRAMHGVLVVANLGKHQARAKHRHHYCKSDNQGCADSERLHDTSPLRHLIQG